MTVSRDVIQDLLPLYLAGEASADTRALVDAHLASDPQLARLVAAARREGSTPPGLPGLSALPPVAPAAPEAEKAALERTRALLKSRTSTLAMALLFTALPLSFVFEGSRVTFLLIRDAPIVGWAWWFTAAILWLWHLGIRRRLRVAGL